MSDPVNLGEVTKLPCGRDCGAVFQMLGLVEPLVIQRAALRAGWWITEVDGREVLVCTGCRPSPEAA